MAELQLSVRSAKARDLAHRLARRGNRSVADVVECAWKAYEVRETRREAADAFYRRLTAEFSADIDLDEILRANRQPHKGSDL